jgi:hypothetical protein
MQNETPALKLWPQIAGKYSFVSQDNFDEYLKAAGKKLTLVVKQRTFFLRALFPLIFQILF